MSTNCRIAVAEPDDEGSNTTLTLQLELAGTEIPLQVSFVIKNWLAAGGNVFGSALMIVAVPKSGALPIFETLIVLGVLCIRTRVLGNARLAADNVTTGAEPAVVPVPCKFTTKGDRKGPLCEACS